MCCDYVVWLCNKKMVFYKVLFRIDDKCNIVCCVMFIRFIKFLNYKFLQVELGVYVVFDMNKMYIVVINCGSF